MAKRNRIVIDLDKARAKGQGRVRARRSGRAGRVLLFIGVVLVVIIVGTAAGGYFWWRHYQTGPAYSLALLVDAAQRNDTAEIDRRLNMDKITDNFVSQVRARVTGSSLVESFLPSQTVQSYSSPRLKQTVHDNLTHELRRLTERAAGKPFALVVIAVPYFVSVKQDGNAASVETKLQDEQIRLTMQADASRGWQIVAVQDDKLTELIAESVRKDLPKSPGQWQEGLEKELKRIKPPAISQ